MISFYFTLKINQKIDTFRQGFYREFKFCSIVRLKKVKSKCVRKICFKLLSNRCQFACVGQKLNFQNAFLGILKLLPHWNLVSLAIGQDKSSGLSTSAEVSECLNRSVILSLDLLSLGYCYPKFHSNLQCAYYYITRKFTKTVFFVKCHVLLFENQTKKMLLYI